MTVRVTVDPGICMGSGTCIAVAPEFFDIGEDGTAYPLRTAVQDSALLQLAVTRCPTGAIEVNPAPSA